MRRRDTIRWLAASSASLALPAYAQANRLVFGQSAALSGPAAELGRQMNLGARLCLDAVNAQGGIHGVEIELRTLDDGYEPDRCRANTDQFIQDDEFGLFGYVGTPTSLAALPHVLDAKIPFFAPVTGAQSQREPIHRTVFHVRASYYEETALIVRQLTALGLKKIAVFYQNDSYGQSGLEGVKRALQAQGLQPAALGTVERNSVDVSAAVKAIAAAAPDAVVQISAYNPAPRSSARHARPATAASSSTSRSLGLRRWPTSWARKRAASSSARSCRSRSRPPPRFRETTWRPSPRPAAKRCRTTRAWRDFWARRY